MIDHPSEYKSGYRVIEAMLRKKDCGVNKRLDLEITCGPKEFDRAIDRMLHQYQSTYPNLRIYATMEPHDMGKAIAMFNINAATARLNGNEERFYLRARENMASCLSVSDTIVKGTRKYMIDADDDDTYKEAIDTLEKYEIPCYCYPTKSGHHVIFNARDISPAEKDERFKKLIREHKNARFMLWRY